MKLCQTARDSRVDVAVMLSETPFDFLSLRLDREHSEPAENKTLATWTRPGEIQRGGASQCEGWDGAFGADFAGSYHCTALMTAVLSTGRSITH